MKIKNLQKGPRGIITTKGAVLLDPEQEIEADVTKSEHAVAKSTGWFELTGSPVADAKPTSASPSADTDAMQREIGELTKTIEAKDAEIAVLKKQLEEKGSGSAPSGKLEAKHRGGGSYSIVDADGTEVMEKLSKDDAEAFNAMSDEDKAAYVAKS